MTLTIELTEEQARALKARAEARGVTLEGLAKQVVESHLAHDESWAYLQQTDSEEWWRRFHAWAESHDRTTPPLSDYAVSRDSIYD